MLKTFGCIFLVFFSWTAFGQRCHCQHFVRRSSDGVGFINGLQIPVNPGDTVCLSAGNYRSLRITNIHGDANHPVVFINCGGQVNIGSGQFAVSITDCSFFHITGTGDSTRQFGIRVTNPLPRVYDNVGIGIGGNSSDAEIDHVEISKMQTGILVKNDPDCRPSTWEESHNFHNISFHDLYIHRIVDFGFLVGYPGATVTLSCGGEKKTVNPQKIYGLRIYQCRLDSLGGSAIEVSDAPSGVEISHNFVEHYGLRSKAWFQEGIIMGGLVNGTCHDNLVEEGTGSGIQILGTGKILVYNNILVHTSQDGEDAVFIDDRPSPEYKPLRVDLVNNTIIGAGRNAVRIQNQGGTISGDNLIYNNLILACKEPFFFGAGHRLSHNLIHLDPKWAKLDDQYAPMTGSPAVSAGANVASFGITQDFNGHERMDGKSVDVGAVQMDRHPSGVHPSDQ
ncbi:MAG TPA: right-handed parallel beta-helix repeat-containing protein [Chitinophagaceae bacterium]|nr:right-handed parallel beta-helix repeat-containing protein [Chitinophagaceae bacterium]